MRGMNSLNAPAPDFVVRHDNVLLCRTGAHELPGTLLAVAYGNIQRTQRASPADCNRVYKKG